MSHDLIRSATGILLLTAIFISTGDKLIPIITSGSNQRPARPESTPSGISQSDWGGILQVHEDWKHSIRKDGDGWRTHNSETALTARFDRRGVEIQPNGSDWIWGLELVGLGVGTAQITTEGIVPKVQAVGRRIGYEWNDNVEEWYQNDDRGLEHGYTIRTRPASPETDDLILRLRLRGGLRVVGSVAGRSLAFGDEKVGERVRYSDLKVLDAAGRDLPASFESDDEDGIRIRIDDGEASYPLTIDPIIQQGYLKASNAGAGDNFGSSVAISGETVVVGAYGEDSRATGGPSDNRVNDAGAAYLYLPNTTPTITAASGITMIAGSMISSLTIATVADAETSAGSLTVTVTSANPSNGVTISNIVNTAGTVTANIVAASGATSTTFTLQVSDGLATASAVLLVNLDSSAVTGDAVKVEIPGGNGVVGPGTVLTLTQVLNNNTSAPISITYIATLPFGLTALAGSCNASGGSCTANTATSSSDHLSGVIRKPALIAAVKTVTWTGTIPANGSVTITYLAQVVVQATSGSQYCITSKIGNTPGPTTCIRVNTPSSGPGNLPIAAGLPNQQKPGSLLIFNVYSSSVNTARSDTQISLTNTNPVSPANVHLFFVDGSNCSVADQIVTLTQNQTVTFRASDVDPGVTGYLIAVAVDQSGCPVVGNYLIGVEDVRFESGHQATLSAIAVSALGVGATLCLPNSVAMTLAFNGLQYDELPRGLGIASLPSLANGNSPMLIINRIGGDLTSGAELLGPLAGLLFDDSEISQSFTLTGGTCQMRGMIGNNLPRTVPRYAKVIPAGRTGWMKFWAAGDEALTGVMINATTSGFSGGYNLQSLTTTGTATLTIPVTPVR